MQKCKYRAGNRTDGTVSDVTLVVPFQGQAKYIYISTTCVEMYAYAYIYISFWKISRMLCPQGKTLEEELINNLESFD